MAVQFAVKQKARCAKENIMDKLSPKALMKSALDAQSAANEKAKDKYKGPTREEMDRAARMMEANIPPGSSSRLRNTNPMPSKEEADKQRMEMEKALLKGATEGIGGKAMGMKKGGVITDLKKAGFYDAKKDKAKRLDIINKVTTKPQRIEMVDKMFSAKKMAKGGTASSRADGCAVRGKTKA